MTTIKTILIEDEELAQQRLIKILQNFPQIEVVGQAFDGLTGIEKIDTLKPDLILLDIEMPGCNGFELLARIEHQPQVIFTTAYDHYAIKAFEENSIDYLLKPIERARVEKAIARVKVGESSDIEGIVNRILSLKAENAYMKRLHVKIGDRTLLVQVNEITHFESADKYTTVHLNEKEYIIDNPLIELEKKLDPSLFLRIHRSLLVNTSWISEIHRNLGGKLQVQLKNDAKTRLGVSRSFVDKVKNL